MTPHDDIPPPPYSETDIFSQAGTHSPAAPSPHHSQHNTDDAYSTSIAGDVILTPPDTPRQSGLGLYTYLHDTNPAAAAYFDSRPAPAVVPSLPVTQRLTVNVSSTPADFPFSGERAADLGVRDVSEQDWQTFINFMIPHHDVQSNDGVVDRKLAAERERSEDGEARNAEQALGSLKLDDGIEEGVRHDGFMSEQRRKEVERTVTEWNAGFFGPRGITVLAELEVPVEERRIPGSWDQSFDGPERVEPGNAEGSQPRNPTQNAREATWQIGGVRVSVGGPLVDDNGNIRFGPFSADQSGLRFRNQNIFPFRGGPPPAAGPTGHGPTPRGPSGHRHGPGARGRSSSTSSVSSVDSDSSAGSLPDYDDLFGDQLTVFMSTLQGWLSNPSQPITRAEIGQLKDRLRAARAQGKAQARCSAPNGRDKAAVKKELKPMLQQLKQLKKQQKQARKQQKREARQTRRQLKRELREARRAARRGYGPEFSAPPMHPQPPMAPMGPQPPLPPGPPPAVPGGFQIPGLGSMAANPTYSFPPWGGRARGFGGHGFGGHGFGGHGFGGRAGCHRGGPGFGGGFRGRFGHPGFGDPGFSDPGFSDPGFGGRFGGPGFGGRTFPGAWPQSPEDGPSPRIAALHKSAEKLEKEVEKRNQDLVRLEADHAKNEAKAETERSRGRRGGEGMHRWAERQYEGNKMRLQQEIEGLQKSIQGIQMAADEEYAREIAASDTHT